MATVASYRELLVWQRGMALAVECYRVTESFPKTETYGLAIQIRRSAVAVSSNIAEGAGRGQAHDYVHHLFHARGSLYELETQLLLAERLTDIVNADCERLLQLSAEVGRMLNGLVNSLERRLN